MCEKEVSFRQAVKTVKISFSSVAVRKTEIDSVQLVALSADSSFSWRLSSLGVWSAAEKKRLFIWYEYTVINNYKTVLTATTHIFHIFRPFIAKIHSQSLWTYVVIIRMMTWRALRSNCQWKHANYTIPQSASTVEVLLQNQYQRPGGPTTCSYNLWIVTT